MTPNDENPVPPGTSKAVDFSFSQWICLLFVVCTGFSSQMVMPLWVGAVIDDMGISNQAVGQIGSLEFAAVALVSVTVALRIQNFPTRPTVALGLALLILGNFWSAFAATEGLLTVARVICGVGKGLVVSITFSLVAGSYRPTRAFATLNIVYAIFSTVFYLTVPFSIKWAGAEGAFITMGLVAVAGALFMLGFPAQRLNSTAIAEIKLSDLPKFGIAGLIALVILWSGHNVVWTFIERLGVSAGLDIAMIGGVLSFAAFLTIAGPALARLLDTRLGYGTPMIVAVIAKALIVFALTYSASQYVYAVAVPAFLLLSLFITPFVLGILSHADPNGRLAAASSAAMTAGSSTGAFIGGVSITAFGFAGLAWSATVHFVIFLILVAIIAPIANRYEAPSAGTPS